MDTHDDEEDAKQAALDRERDDADDLEAETTAEVLRRRLTADLELEANAHEAALLAGLELEAHEARLAEEQRLLAQRQQLRSRAMLGARTAISAREGRDILASFAMGRSPELGPESKRDTLTSRALAAGWRGR